jgi:hypothetical protein
LDNRNLKEMLVIVVGVLLLSSVSFSQKRPKADLAKKIAEATPAMLPQGPVSAWPISDAAADNLKAKVKSVINYSRGPGKTRVVEGEEYYNESGNLIKSVSFDEGYPISVTVWGYVDGKRSSKTGEIRYAKGERPAAKTFELVARAEDNAMRPNDPRDRRFSIRHGYTFDDKKRIIEKRSYQNNGELWLRSTYSYSGDQKEVRDYDARGNEMSRTVYIIDENGDVSEERMFGADDNDVTKHLFKRELDGHGNWVVEKAFEPGKAGGKPAMRLLWTTYRAITYYP